MNESTLATPRLVPCGDQGTRQSSRDFSGTSSGLKAKILIAPLYTYGGIDVISSYHTIPYLYQPFFRHDVGHDLRNVCYCNHFRSKMVIIQTLSLPTDSILFE